MWKIRNFSLQLGLELMTTRMIDDKSLPSEPQKLAEVFISQSYTLLGGAKKIEYGRYRTVLDS